MELEQLIVLVTIDIVQVAATYSLARHHLTSNKLSLSLLKQSHVLQHLLAFRLEHAIASILIGFSLVIVVRAVAGKVLEVHALLIDI